MKKTITKKQKTKPPAAKRLLVIKKVELDQLTQVTGGGLEFYDVSN